MKQRVARSYDYAEFIQALSVFSTLPREKIGCSELGEDTQK